EQEEIQKQERRLMHELLRTVTSPLSRACWQRPLESAVTSKFGSPRSLPDGRSYYHTGVDLRAARGTVLRAAGPGRVAFADEMRVPGKMVVLDHGEGLFTRYMHLDSFAVKMGDTVEKGQVIGRTGATGRVEAPHLHWEVVWKGNFADPLAF